VAGGLVNRFDLQVHTDASPCSGASPADIVDGAVRAGLNGIAITNHDTVKGYAAVNDLAPAELTVIRGVEITTTQGHVIGLDVERVPCTDDPVAAIEAIQAQGGVAVLSHPFDRFRDRFSDELDRIAQVVDGVETRNSRCLLERFNERAATYANEHSLAVTGGSDAHFPMEICRTYTECAGSVIDAIRHSETRVGGRGRYVSGHVATKVHELRHLVGSAPQ
jgi:predicted metal-dependent phosphoesterase TrpH